MTKDQAFAEWRAYVLPGVVRAYERDGIPDRPARRESWNNYVDMLARDRQITAKQAETWDHPRGLETCKPR